MNHAPEGNRPPLSHTPQGGVGLAYPGDFWIPSGGHRKRWREHPLISRKDTMRAAILLLSLSIAGCAGYDFTQNTSELCGALCSAIESVEALTASPDTSGLGDAQAALRSALAIAASGELD